MYIRAQKDPKLTCVGRYVSKADIIQGRKELDGEKNRAAQDENRRQQDKERSLKIRPSKRKEQVQMGVAQEDDILDMSDTEPEWIVGASVLPCVNRPSSQTSDCNLVGRKPYWIASKLRPVPANIH